MTEADPWAELVATATNTIRRIEKGETLAVRDALQGAVIGLRDVLAGRLPDPERQVYLRFLLSALAQIESGVTSDKALGLWSAGPPQSVTEERDFVLFWKVSQALNSIKKTESDKPVEDAISKVVRDYAKRGIAAASEHSQPHKFGTPPRPGTPRRSVSATAKIGCTADPESGDRGIPLSSLGYPPTVQPTVTSILRGRSSARFGMLTESTPLLTLATVFPASSSPLNVKLRR
jgi:hypothetical protein